MCAWNCKSRLKVEKWAFPRIPRENTEEFYKYVIEFRTELRSRKGTICESEAGKKKEADRVKSGHPRKWST